MSLLQMSVTGGVMILAITVLRALAMNRVPKKTFLALWGTALLRLTLPVSLPSVLSIYSLLGQKMAPAMKKLPAAAFYAFPSGQTAAVLRGLFWHSLLEMLSGVPHVLSSGQ